METIIAPVKPLGLLVPHRDKETGRLEWRLFLVTISLLATTSGVVFIPTASLLYLSDKFKFKAEQVSWVVSSRRVEASCRKRQVDSHVAKLTEERLGVGVPDLFPIHLHPAHLPGDPEGRAKAVPPIPRTQGRTAKDGEVALAPASELQEA